MADSFIRVAPDSTGKLVQTFQNVIGANTVEANAVGLVDQFGVPIGSSGSPLFVRSPDTFVAGTLTAADTVAGIPADAGGFRAGTSTAGSVVSVPVGGGDAVFSVAVTGSGWSGSIYFEGSVNSTNGTDGNWIQLNAHRSGIINTTIVGFATDSGLYRGSVVGLTYFRVRAVTGFTPTATIGIRLSSGPAPILPVGGIPGPNLVRGVQGASGYSTQDLKDAGRTRVSIVFQSTAPATADTLLSLVKVSNGVAAAGATSVAVAANKTLRLTALAFSVRANAASAAWATMTLRQNPAGATVIGSPSELRVDAGTTSAVIGASVAQNIAFPDGLEFSGTQTLGVSLSAQATTNIISIALLGFEY